MKKTLSLSAAANLDHTKNLSRYIWRPSRLSELTPMVFNTGLTHLGLEASIYILIKKALM